MEILAAKKHIAKPKITYLSHVKKHRIAVRINTILYSTIQHYLSSMHSSGDYTYSSISNLLREVILKIEREGLPNNCIPLGTGQVEYNEMILRVSVVQKQFWQSLPKGSRRKILEKAISSFIKS